MIAVLAIVLFVRKLHKSLNLMQAVLALVGIVICISWLYITSEYAVFGLIILLVYVGVIAILFALFNYLFSLPKEMFSKTASTANYFWFFIIVFMSGSVLSGSKNDNVFLLEDEINIQDVLHGAYMDHPQIKTLGIRRVTDYSDVFRLIGTSTSIVVLLIIWLYKKMSLED